MRWRHPYAIRLVAAILLSVFVFVVFVVGGTIDLLCAAWRVARESSVPLLALEPERSIHRFWTCE